MGINSLKEYSEVAIVGGRSDFYPVDLTTPPQEVIVGGLRLYELLGLLLCREGRGARLYNVVDDVHVGCRSPSLLKELPCRIDVEYTTEAPPGVPLVSVEQIVDMFLRNSLDFRPTSNSLNLVDVVRLNVEVMSRVVGLIREVVGDNVFGGRVRSDVPKDVVVVKGTVREYVVFEGPAVVGPQSEILPFTYVRGAALYLGCKVRDEVKNVVLDVFSKKPHGGYLGDSYVGKFVNFGAGTNVSNLKNTYGSIRVRTRGGYVEAGRKMGALVGDFVKTAVNTTIYCGKSIGPFSHLYGTVIEDVPPFVIYARSLGVDPVELDLEKALEIYRREYGDMIMPSYDRVILAAYERSKRAREEAGITRGKYKLVTST